MNNVNIFDEVQQGEFFSFKQIGDSIQGTYIGAIYNTTDGYQNRQNIYIIQDADGKIWNIGFKLSNVVCCERMATIHLGQIVGFRFDEERESRNNPGKNKAKIIRIYADPKFINQEWLDRQKELGIMEGPQLSQGRPVENEQGVEEEEGEVDTSFTVPENATTASGSLPTANEVKPRNEAVDAILTLAKTKGLTNDTMSEEEEKEAIEKYTELPLIEANLTKVIIKLTGYTNK